MLAFIQARPLDGLMNIKSLNKDEDAKAKKFQNAMVGTYKRNIKRYGFSDKAQKEIKKDLRSIMRELVKSGIKIGEEWLNLK